VTLDGILSMMKPLEELRELEAKATPGPWEAIPGGEPPHVIDGQTAFDVLGPYPLQDDAGGGWMTEENAALIAAMRNALPALLDVAEAAIKDGYDDPASPTNTSVALARLNGTKEQKPPVLESDA
jgi:hypothetical protein